MMRKINKIIYERKLVLLKRISDLLFGDYRLVWPDLDWWNDGEFNSFLYNFKELKGFNSQRRWMLKQLLRLTAMVPGDTAECGVYRGASSWLICESNQKSEYHKRTHHLFDSFAGLSRPSPIDGVHWKIGSLSAEEALVARNLSVFSKNIIIHKGWIPSRFADVKEKQFSFVHIDVDLYEPTRDSVAFFYDRLSHGGILLCDDYAFSTCPGATLAVDEFLHDKPEKMLALDSGGGFFIKGIQIQAGEVL